MKKLLIVPALFFFGWASAQSDCLQTGCVAVHAKVGDTVQIGAVYTTSNKVASLVCTQVSGPNTAVQINSTSNYAASLQDTVRVNLAGLAVGTYVFEFLGKDQSGGVTAPGYDSIVVAPTVACPAIPGPPTMTGVTVTVFGVPIVIPAGQGTKITFTYNGQTQTVTF
jgi:hypothetical protein